MVDNEENFENIIKEDVVDLPLLKKLCYVGIPTKYRLIVYQIMFGVVGLNTSRFEAEQASNRSKYLRYLKDSIVDKEIECKNGIRGLDDVSKDIHKPELSEIVSLKDFNRSNSVRFEIPRKLDHQIYIDVMRINSTYRKHRGIDMSPMFSNILKITARKRPFIGYVQGMADLITPFLHLAVLNVDENYDSSISYDSLVYDSQPTVYFCFNNLLNRIQHNIFDLQEKLIQKLEFVLNVVDKEVLDALNEQGLRLHMICIRWFSCLFIREFQIDAWYRIFDSMICGDIDEFIVFFGAAVLIWFRASILSSDFSSTVILMQNLQEQELNLDNVETLIGSVSFLKEEYYNKNTDIE